MASIKYRLVYLLGNDLISFSVNLKQDSSLFYEYFRASVTWLQHLAFLSYILILMLRIFYQLPLSVLCGNP